MTQFCVLIHVNLKVKWTFFYTGLAPRPDKLNGSIHLHTVCLQGIYTILNLTLSFVYGLNEENSNV